MPGAPLSASSACWPGKRKNMPLWGKSDTPTHSSPSPNYQGHLLCTTSTIPSPPLSRAVSQFKEKLCLALLWDLQFLEKKKKYPKHSKQQQCITYQPLQTEDSSEQQQRSFFPTVLHCSGTLYLITGLCCIPGYVVHTKLYSF